MKFRTSYIPVRSHLSLDPTRPAFLIGSCFSDNMRGRMRQGLWDARNPFGTLYNPASIADVLRAVLDYQSASMLVGQSIFTDPRWLSHSYMFDSSFSHYDNEEAVANDIQALCLKAREELEEARTLFVTFGTATVYTASDFGARIVANCHKQPGAQFEVRHLSVEECVEIWSPLLEELHRNFPSLRVIFTVSPVRHLKDGFIRNARSKATLLLAIEQLVKEFPEFTDYFPAYEILMDDLRDYRFYAADMLHPSAEALEYIWEMLCTTYLDKAGVAALKEGEALVREFAHRPLIPSDPANEKRRRQILDKAAAFASRYPYMLHLPDTASNIST